MRTLLSLTTLATVLLFASTALGAPALHVAEPTYDFGKVYQGEKVPHTFVFSNTGDDVLKIDRVQSSCGCTAVLVSANELAPGAQGELQATFDSGRFRGDISKTIYVYSNDPLNPVLQMHLKGQVLETVVVEPRQVNFGKVTAGQQVATTVVLHNQGTSPLTIGKPGTTAAELQALAKTGALPAGGTVTLELKFKPKPGQERFSAYALIPIEGVPQNELRIPVYATVSGQ